VEDGAKLPARLEATYAWLCQAQDAGTDDGVCGIFDLWSGTWSESYPETTGYIIPTLLALANAREEEEPRRRALRMADWSCEQQMEDGAVLSGLLGMQRGPAVFNTGQVVFGWVSAFQQSGERRYALAARRGCEWLLANQSPDGAWRANLSVMTSAPVFAYNVRCAWALIYAGEVLEEPLFAAAAQRAEPPLERLRELLHAWLEHIAAHLDHMRVFQQERHVIEREPRWGDIRAKRLQFERILDGLLAQCEQDGSLTVDDRRLALLALLGMVNYTSTWYRGGGRLRPRQIADGYHDMLVSAYRPRGESR